MTCILPKNKVTVFIKNDEELVDREQEGQTEKTRFFEKIY